MSEQSIDPVSFTSEESPSKKKFNEELLTFRDSIIVCMYLGLANTVIGVVTGLVLTSWQNFKLTLMAFLLNIIWILGLIVTDRLLKQFQLV